MDVVYPVGPGDRNEELRYSLRSLTNLPHDTVWVAGHLPSWVAGVHHLIVAQAANRYRNAAANIRSACEHRAVSDPFILMNDDFFIVDRVDHIPVAHQGPVSLVLTAYERRHGQRRPYAMGMADTADLLHRLGITRPLSYELHLPMVIGKTEMLEVLELGADIDVPHVRTLYGNYHRIGGDLTDDVKIRGTQDQWPAGPFLSTSDAAFKTGPAGRHIRSMFPDPSEHEEVAMQRGHLLTRER